jgi:hypothetical protein
VEKSHRDWCSKEEEAGEMTGLVKGKIVLKLILDWTISYQGESGIG